MTTYVVPRKPADPEGAALDLIASVPAEVLDPAVAQVMTEVLQDYAGVHATAKVTF